MFTEREQRIISDVKEILTTGTHFKLYYTNINGEIIYYTIGCNCIYIEIK